MKLENSAVWMFVFAVMASSVNAPAQSTETNLYWGDTHLHTYNSPDAFLMQNRSVSPDDAYRFAKGEPIVHPYSKVVIRLHTPLDFLVVSDHAEAIGAVRKVFEGDARIADTAFGRLILSAAKVGREAQAFDTLIAATNQPRRHGQVLPGDAATKVVRERIHEVGLDVWRETIDAALRHNAPGTFTSFLGWEWTSAPDGANLHRVVFVREDPSIGSEFYPYSAIQSTAPEDLWAWLEATAEKTGAHFISIPHNSNLSKGVMFNENDSEGRPITAEYARTRMKWEPIVEITQVKGDSETHTQLSPTDEFADYETYGFVLEAGSVTEDTDAKAGSYVRSALRRGLEIEGKTGVNPYKFGVVGSTDSHTGASTTEEDNFWGKFGIGSTPETKNDVVLTGATGADMGAQGLAAVWATENTRGSLFDAFRRKEVYGTTGPRIRVRFFGGWSYKNKDADSGNLATIGYRKGVPMGGDLTSAPAGKSPSFLIHAAKDPRGANLDRVQVVKGWIDSDGMSHEKVYDVALSDGRVAQGGKVPSVGNTVNLKTAAYTNSIGDAQLATVWSDPDFDASQRSFYYLRVLQIPTPRHTLYDAVATQQDHPAERPATLQERAYTSPIWYTPAS